jgi:hypothetical protein
MLPLAPMLFGGGGNIGPCVSIPHCQKVDIVEYIQNEYQPYDLFSTHKYVSKMPNQTCIEVRKQAAVDQPEQQQDPAAAISSHLRSLPTFP